MKRGNWILAVPSFWGLLTWTVALCAYLFMDIGWYEPHVGSLAVLFGMLLCFLLSTALFAPLFKSTFDRRFDRLVPKIGFKWILLLHLAGLGATMLFISDVNHSGHLPDDFLYLLMTDPLVIRRVPLGELTRGVYLGYLGWLAVFLSATQIAMHRKHRYIYLLLVALQIAANLVFLNKMRPVIVTFLFIVPWLILTTRYRLVRLATMGGALLAAIVVFFIVWSDATGKTFELGIGYSPAVETFLLYLTSGPAYLSHILLVEDPEMTLARTLRPLYVVFSLLFDIPAPPSPILPFYDIPISTNVGTALEPWFRDIGTVGVILGTIALSFGVDLIAYIGLRFGRVTGLLVTLMMCYCSIFAFFVPRITTGPVFMVMMLLLFHALLVALARLSRPMDS